MRLPQPQLVKTKLSCETSLQKNSWRCENKAFVRDIPQKVTVEDVKTSFRSRLPAKFNFEGEFAQNDAWSDSYTAGPTRAWSEDTRECFPTAARQTFPIHLPRHALSCKTQRASANSQNRISCETSLKIWKWMKMEDVKMKLSCETPLQKWQLKIWKQSCRARHPSKSDSWSCENEAFAPDFPHTHTHPHTHTLAFSEPFLRILVWNASYVQKHSNYAWHLTGWGRWKDPRKIETVPSPCPVLDEVSWQIATTARRLPKRHGGSWVEPLPIIRKWKLNGSRPWATGNHNNAGTPGWSPPASTIMHSFVGMRLHDGRMPPAVKNRVEVLHPFRCLTHTHTPSRGRVGN